MMAALIKNQGKDGAWRQLIDNDASWPETSSTGMFTFALISGVRNGWLDAAVPPRSVGSSGLSAS